MAEALANRDRIRAAQQTGLDQHGDAYPPTMTAGQMADEANAEKFVVKDSGVREQFDSGMVRDTAEGKTNFALVLDGPMFWRWATHLTKGAVKYAARNWMKARGDAELERFKESAFRHFMQWYNGEEDEDHAAAVFFNINGAEYVRNLQKLDGLLGQAKADISDIDQ